MKFLLIFLCFFLFLNKTAAKSFNYEFVLSDNLIDLNFFKVLDLPIEDLQLEHGNIISFEYILNKTANLPQEIPLFILALGKQVLFSVDAKMADGIVHQVSLDLSQFGSLSTAEMPIFYKNNYLDNFELEIKNLLFTKDSSEKLSEDSQIKNLSAIREADQSLTIIFSLEGENLRDHRYEIFCLGDGGKIANSSKLTRTDDFLWPNFSFLRFFANYKNELIFNLNEFACDGLVYLQNDVGLRSDQTSIVEVTDL